MFAFSYILYYDVYIDTLETSFLIYFTIKSFKSNDQTHSKEFTIQSAFDFRDT